MNDILPKVQENMQLKTVLQSAKHCLEVTKTDIEEGFQLDWFNIAYINQEIEKIENLIEREFE